MYNVSKKIAVFIPLLALSACSVFEGKGDEIIFDKTLGPKTQAQIKPLPKDLRGDKAGENLSGEALKNSDLEKDGM